MSERTVNTLEVDVSTRLRRPADRRGASTRLETGPRVLALLTEARLNGARFFLVFRNSGNLSAAAVTAEGTRYTKYSHSHTHTFESPLSEMRSGAHQPPSQVPSQCASRLNPAWRALSLFFTAALR